MPDYAEYLDRIMPTALWGSVAQTVGMTVSAAGFPAPVGAVAEVQRQADAPLLAEVIGFRDDLTLLYPLSELSGVRRGNRVRLVRTTRWLRVGAGAVGPGDRRRGPRHRRPAPAGVDRPHVSLHRHPPDPCTRPRIDEPLATGVRAIDGLLTCGKGQRMGIFSGSGVGKSVLLGMMARYTDGRRDRHRPDRRAGPRGQRFHRARPGPRGPGQERGRGGHAATSRPWSASRRPATATAVAEYFRDQGKDVLLLMDSLTRFALGPARDRPGGRRAARPPAAFRPRSSPCCPSWSSGPAALRQGSITAFYTVLVEADDPNEPISDAVRGLLDGHTWLSRNLASRGHYPAVDVLESVSRLMPEVADEEHRRAVYALRELLAAYRDHEDLISIGAYRRGSNRTVDAAIDMRAEIDGYLRQPVEQPSSPADARDGLLKIYEHYRRRFTAIPPEAC